MPKLSLKFGAKTRTLKLPIDRPENIFVEAANGEEVRVQKIYHVEGRGECIKILVDDLFENPADLDEIHNLKTEVADLVVELQGKNEELLIDNNSLACNIKELMAENEKLKSQLGV